MNHEILFQFPALGVLRFSMSNPIADFDQLFHHSMQVALPLPRAERVVQRLVQPV
jgi:phage tail protein X